MVAVLWQTWRSGELQRFYCSVGDVTKEHCTVHEAARWAASLGAIALQTIEPRPSLPWPAWSPEPVSPYLLGPARETLVVTTSWLKPCAG